MPSLASFLIAVWMVAADSGVKLLVREPVRPAKERCAGILLDIWNGKGVVIRIGKKGQV